MDDPGDELGLDDFLQAYPGIVIITPPPFIPEFCGCYYCIIGMGMLAGDLREVFGFWPEVN